LNTLNGAKMLLLQLINLWITGFLDIVHRPEF
jgi:hypothetical protein